MKYTLEEIQMNRSWWTAQLRSGNYEQGRGALVSGRTLHGQPEGGHEFCCLGIPAWYQYKNGKIFGAERINTREYVFNDQEEYFFSDQEIKTDRPYWYLEAGISKAFLPVSVAAALGLNQESQEILAHLNDSEVSFSVIADVVHKLPVEFTEVDRKISFPEES